MFTVKCLKEQLECKFLTLQKRLSLQGLPIVSFCAVLNTTQETTLFFFTCTQVCHRQNVYQKLSVHVCLTCSLTLSPDSILHSTCKINRKIIALKKGIATRPAFYEGKLKILRNSILAFFVSTEVTLTATFTVLKRRR